MRMNLFVNWANASHLSLKTSASSSMKCCMSIARCMPIWKRQAARRALPIMSKICCRIPTRNPHAYKWMDKPFVEMLDEFFTDTRIKDLLCALTGYLSDDPKSLTVGNMAPIFGYHFDGGYYPVGGSQAFPNALVDVIEKHGGKVFLRTPVQRIVMENGHAVGVELKNGQTHRAKAILSNADTHKTFLELIGREHIPADFAQQIESLKPSATAFIVFLGLDIAPNLAPITMLDDIGIMIPSNVDATLAPLGHASVTLLKLLPQSDFANWDRKSPGYLERKHKFADEMIASAAEVIPGLQTAHHLSAGRHARHLRPLRVDNERFHLWSRRRAEKTDCQNACEEFVRRWLRHNGRRDRSCGHRGHSRRK